MLDRVCTPAIPRIVDSRLPGGVVPFPGGGGHCHGHWDVVVSRLLPRTLAVVTRPALVRLLQIHPLEIGPSTLQPSKPTHEAVVYTF